MVEARQAASTVRFVDTYCELYKNLFVEVRAYEYFKYIHVGLISDIKRKSLPEIAKVVGLENAQGLHHCLDAVAHGGNPQDRAASLLKQVPLVS
ncbi:hypothetical protein BJP34_33675 [Moorena producens PAL-8-15-08-1]|uniref:Uncharacterized protein n=1 Tax=Moorena producens PAL-8-15-08-1 TaxID=1458985 RepID=A0A1D8U209_9CYAN|nr:hypothetical protein BJP34_12630 [Moorena producens PAL-8-15-08-1]AOX03726.1 hypothetical protein BJP34_33675 [Moorena producens PAL-8-15-08-1]